MDTQAREQRLRVLQKMAEYEEKQYFDRDLEDDPPTVPLRPGEVDYLRKKPISRLKTFVANRVAYAYFERLIRKGQLLIREVRGMEHFLSVEGGALLTCNHFHPFDNYAVFKAIEKQLPTRELYKIIREGNYTSFPGLYGFFFRHCNTLPLGASLHVLGELNRAVSVLLERGERILIYPEGAMWWNYRKPRPYKEASFHFAAKNQKPVIPFFITMQDSDRADESGFPIQAYIVHILPPIYPSPSLSVRENAKRMKEQNEACVKELYESVYGVPLSYR